MLGDVVEGGGEDCCLAVCVFVGREAGVQRGVVVVFAGGLLKSGLEGW